MTAPDQATQDARNWQQEADEADESMTREEVEEYRADLILSSRYDSEDQ